MLKVVTVGIDDVYDYASSNNCLTHIAAAKLGSPLITKVEIWPETIDFAEAKKIDSPNLCCSQRGDLITELSKQIDGYLQFPSSTIFLHGIGCVSSAMTKAFKVAGRGGFDFITPSLYVITAQPPSTGKSEVNSKFFTPILKAYKRINELHERERGQLKREIKRLEKQIDNLKPSEANEHQDIELNDKLELKEKRLREIPMWKAALTNVTVETLDEMALNNDGMFNIISAEAEAVNVVVGGVYGDGKNKANVEILLKGWCGEYYASQRIGRAGYTGEARGSIVVIAQDDTIDSLLASGSSGRGLPERFLLLSEKSKLGYRDHNIKYSFDKSIYARYEQLIDNIISEENVQLTFSKDAEQALANYKTKLEPTMRDGGINSHNLPTGFIGKTDRQIRKISSVLHVIDQWQDGADKSRTITDDYVFWAMSIFEELSKTFINSADYMGYVGSNSEVQKVIEIISNSASKGKIKISISFIRDRVKNGAPFKGSRDVTQRIKESLIVAESLNYCVVSGSTIHINPRLK